MASIGGDKEVRLFDVSHGAGVLPPGSGQADGDNNLNPWPKRTMYEYMGYAGGLGPLNIAVQLQLIEAHADPLNFGPYWIDMESRVRTRTIERNVVKDVLDLKKVKDVCKGIWD
jgi:hypothetical protein